MKSLDESLQKRLAKRQEIGLLRSIGESIGGTDFVSNDYLGLGKKAISITSHDVPQARGSRNLVGSASKLLELEKAYANYFNAEACLVLPSGYQANLALLLAVVQPSTTILYDEHVHNSLRRAIQLSGAKALKVRHNNSGHLMQRLNNAEGPFLVICESLYSMHGDFCPLEDWSNICNALGAWLWVDEAHTAGWYGEKGAGMRATQNLDIPLVSIGLGKAMGTQGGLILGSKTLMQAIVNFGDPAIYSTAISDLHIQELAKRLAQVKAADSERKQLQKIIETYQEKAHQVLGYMHSNSPIQSIHIGSPEKTTAIAQALRNEQIEVAAVRYPTVPQKKDRLRISLHSYNTDEEIEHLIKSIEKYV